VDGCLALAERPVPIGLTDVIAKSDLVLVLEGVTDADNVGSAFRNAAAFGASDRKRAAKPYAWAADWPDDLTALKADGFAIVALTSACRSATMSIR
jgi:hypothetical protein